MFSDEIFDTISAPDHGRYFAMGFTYSGHPVSCAAALKNIEIMEREQIFDNVADVGPYFISQLETLGDLSIVGDVRGSHLMACVEFVANKKTTEPFADDVSIGKLVSIEAEKLGLVVRPFENLNIMSPSLIITRDDVDEIVSRLRQAIINTASNLLL